MTVVYHIDVAQRYFIAIPIPQHIQTILNDLSQQATGKPSPVLFPHISLIPPFTLKDRVAEENISHIVSTIKIAAFSAHLGSIDVFHQHDRSILIINVEPNEIFENHNATITTILSPFIIIDTTPYTDGVVPKFRAHTTIDYDAKLQPEDEERMDNCHLFLQFGRLALLNYIRKSGGKWEVNLVRCVFNVGHNGMVQ